MENKILTITTQGCESCYILDKLINEALTITKKEVEYVKQDFKEVDKKLIKSYNITDFPTTLLIKDDVVKFRFIGTRPAVVIARWIDVHL